MMGRVTLQTMAATAQRNLQSSSVKLAQAQESATGLKKFARVSDDPAAAADALAVRGQQAASAQYGRNISDGVAWMATADSALASATTLLQQAKDLTLRGANTVNNADVREAIAVQLDSVRADLMATANTQYMGRNIFAGNSGQGAAYTDNPVAFTGEPGSTVERRIGTNATVRVDADGGAIFGRDNTDGKGDSVFGLLKTIADTLRSGGDVAAHINDMDQALSAVINGRSEVGARHAQLLRAQDANANTAVDLENQRSGIEDLDLSKAILDVKTQELAYQTALGITAKVLQPTLMDFLR